jgi:hypothetical protein
MILSLVILLLAINYLYFRLTKYTKEIIVSKKYIKTVLKTDSYFVFDKTGQLYTIDFCPWALNFNYKTIWESIVEGQKYKIDIYGININFLNVYRNIVKIE